MPSIIDILGEDASRELSANMHRTANTKKISGHIDNGYFRTEEKFYQVSIDEIRDARLGDHVPVNAVTGGVWAEHLELDSDKFNARWPGAKQGIEGYVTLTSTELVNVSFGSMGGFDLYLDPESFDPRIDHSRFGTPLLAKIHAQDGTYSIQITARRTDRSGTILVGSDRGRDDPVRATTLLIDDDGDLCPYDEVEGYALPGARVDFFGVGEASPKKFGMHVLMQRDQEIERVMEVYRVHEYTNIWDLITLQPLWLPRDSGYKKGDILSVRMNESGEILEHAPITELPYDQTGEILEDGQEDEMGIHRSTISGSNGSADILWSVTSRYWAGSTEWTECTKFEKGQKLQYESIEVNGKHYVTAAAFIK